MSDPPGKSIAARNDVVGYVVDLFDRTTYPGRVRIVDGRINAIEPIDASELPADAGYLMPGFVDGHVHIESSMLTPSRFAIAAVRHGTIATVSDPHEIANVLGEDGVKFMLDDAATVPLKFHFGVPSCVPATKFETAGAVLDVAATERLLDDPRLSYLSEMMNFPGVIHGDADVLAKIAAAKRRGKLVDGHAPGFRGDAMRAYFAAGITTDHECFTADEAIEKLEAGVVIQIREGSAAKNFDALHGLIDRHADRMMFCSDDKHPDDLLEGHINAVCRRAVAVGHDVYDVLKMACVNPVQHYGLDVGQLRPDDPADFVEVDSLDRFNIRRTFIAGTEVFDGTQVRFELPEVISINRFDSEPKTADDFEIKAHGDRARVIVAEDGLITTRQAMMPVTMENGRVIADPRKDILKLAVVNRYDNASPSVALVHGMGLRGGAIAGSVGHDSHNVIAVGVDDESMCRAVNAVITDRGGLAAVDGSRIETLPLPIAGLMSRDPCEIVAAKYQTIDAMAKDLGSGLTAPLMTLSFLALLVIPSLKLSDLGLFDGDRFSFVDLFGRSDDTK